MPVSPILEPMIILVLWTFVMWFLLYATRIPATYKHNVPMNNDLTPDEFAAQYPKRVRWKADNYNHLFEQPTIFYATTLALGMIGAGDGTNLILAWVYVGLRVAHSIFQAFFNVIMVRFVLFNLSAMVLLTLAIRATIAIFTAPVVS